MSKKAIYIYKSKCKDSTLSRLVYVIYPGLIKNIYASPPLNNLHHLTIVLKVKFLSEVVEGHPDNSTLSDK